HGAGVTVVCVKRGARTEHGQRRSDAAARSKTDKDKLQGSWKLTAGTKGGQEAPPEFLEMAGASFKGDKFTLKLSNKEIEFSFKIDDTKKPRHIDLNIEGKSMPGIYELDGDTLKICVAESERPTEFKGEGNATLLVL